MVNSLRELCDRLNEFEDAQHYSEEEAEELGNALIAEGLGDMVRTGDNSDLPNFGGDEPLDTSGVYSWDEDDLMVNENERFVIVSRAEWFGGRD